MNFQIRYDHGGGSWSYVYFEAEESTMKEIACERANELLAKYRERYDMMRRAQAFMYNYHIPRTCNVVEFDSKTKKAKRGGHKFKIRLNWIDIVLKSGEKIRDDWYVPID